MTTPGYTRSISAWYNFLNSIWQFQVTFLIRVFSCSLTSDFLHTKKICKPLQDSEFFFFFLHLDCFDGNLFFLIPKSLPGWCNSRNKVNISGNDTWLLKQKETRTVWWSPEMLSNHSQDQSGHLTGLWDVAVFTSLGPSLWDRWQELWTQFWMKNIQVYLKGKAGKVKGLRRPRWAG